MGKVLAIRRDDTFSPHSIGKDKAILMAVLQRLGDCQLMDERVFDDALKIPEADAYLSMGRFPKTLERLSQIEKKGKVVVNRGESVCPRYVLEDLMRKHQVAMPPENGRQERMMWSFARTSNSSERLSPVTGNVASLIRW